MHYVIYLCIFIFDDWHEVPDVRLSEFYYYVMVIGQNKNYVTDMANQTLNINIPCWTTRRLIIDVIDISGHSVT